MLISGTLFLAAGTKSSVLLDGFFIFFTLEKSSFFFAPQAPGTGDGTL